MRHAAELARSIAARERLQPRLANVVRRKLRRQISTPFIGRAHVAADELDELVVDGARVDKLERWDDDALVEELR